MLNDPRPPGDRLADITARIEQIPAFLTAMRDRLSEPVARWVELDVEQTRGLPELFATVKRWGQEQHWADVPRLQRANDAARIALESYAAELLELPTTSRFAIGEDAARRRVALRGLDSSLEDLQRLATDFLRENQATLDDLRARLVERHHLDPATNANALREFLDQQFAVPDAAGKPDLVLRRYEREHERVMRFIAERSLFPIPASQELEILQTPPFLQPVIPAGAQVEPPPFREGIRKSLVYLTLSADRIASHSELSIPLMMMHEGIPGHHLQLATASEHPSVIRRHVHSVEHGEGWTTMLEDYMLDIDYMGSLTDEARFCTKQDIRRMGARVAIDLFFMTGEASFLDVGVPWDQSAEDPFAAAGSLLANVTGWSAPKVHGELSWYALEPAYPLCYLAGNKLVWQLKDDMAATGGASGLELDRAFHAAFLSAGNMPLSFLRRLFQQRGLVV